MVESGYTDKLGVGGGVETKECVSFLIQFGMGSCRFLGFHLFTLVY